MVLYSPEKTIATIEVFGVNGQLVIKTDNVSIKNDWQQFPLDISKLESGIYNLRIISEKYIIHKKLILSK